MRNRFKFAVTTILVAVALSAALPPVVAQTATPAASSAKPATGPPPRMLDGTVDFGGKGIWDPKYVVDWTDKKYVGRSIDISLTPWGQGLLNERKANHSKDDPEGWCLPSGVPRFAGTPYPFTMTQLPDRIVMLFERLNAYRTIYMDGRKHSDPKKLNPTWLGESIGQWEGKDTLVVDTIGSNGKSWLDGIGHPASDQLHVIEKFRRPEFLTLDYEVTIEDPKAYSQPWTSNVKIPFRPGLELLEYTCNENNVDVLHLGSTGPK